MLEHIVKKDKHWREEAYKLCGSRTLADDIIQDMYIKLSNKQGLIKDSYVYQTIQSVFIDYCRKNKETRIGEILFLECKERRFEPNDYEKEILDRFEKLDWVTKELIEESYHKSLREIEEEFPLIHYMYAHRKIQKGTMQVLGQNYQTQYKNTRRKQA